MRALAAVLLLLVAMPAPAPGGLSGADVMERMLARRIQGDDAVSLLEVVLIDGGGRETRRLVETYRKRCGAEWRLLTVIRGPADVAGAGVLSWLRPDGPPDMWIYLPELGRVRQLSAIAQSERFLGSDLTIEDLSGQAFHARAHELVGDEELAGEPTHRVESRPLSGIDPYARILTWVSRQTFLPVRVEYYDRRDALLRVGRFGDVVVVKGFPTPSAIVMDNVQTGDRTEVTLREVDFDRGLECELLTRRWLARAP
jgi:hypothetical protein